MLTPRHALGVLHFLLREDLKDGARVP